MTMRFVQSSIAALAIGLAAPAFAQDLPENIDTAVGAAESAGVVEMIVSGEEVTVFVPSNDALSAAPQEELTALQEDSARLGEVIQGYAVSGTVMAADAMQLAMDGGGSATVDSLAGTPLTIMVEGDTVMVGPEGGTMATVTEADRQVGNVTIHVIDTAFLPGS